MAREAFDDVRILAAAQRWNGCVVHLHCACYHGGMALVLLHDPHANGSDDLAWRLEGLAALGRVPEVLAGSLDRVSGLCTAMRDGNPAVQGREDVLALFGTVEELLEYVASSLAD